MHKRASAADERHMPPSHLIVPTYSIRFQRICSWLLAFPYALRYVIILVRLNHDERPALAISRRCKLLKYYVVGSLIGRAVSRYVLRGEVPRRATGMYSRIGGAWGNCLIAADSIIDADRLPPRVAFRLLRTVGEHLRGKANTSALDNAVARFSCRMAREVYEGLHSMRRFANSDSQRIQIEAVITRFYADWKLLCHGELRSIRQRSQFGGSNWRWYLDLLETKTMTLIIAPVRLTARTSRAHLRADAVVNGIRAINELFYHRQVLDDFIDVEQDAEDGIRGAPVYMLLEQARLSSGISQAHLELDPATTAKMILDSGLLPPYCWSWHEVSERIPRIAPIRGELEGCWNAAEVGILLQYALANTPGDFARDLDDLRAAAIDRGNQLNTALQGFASDVIARIVNESGVVWRIHRTATDPRNWLRCERQLQEVGDADILSLFDLLYVRTLRTYRKVLQVWLH